MRHWLLLRIRLLLRHTVRLHSLRSRLSLHRLLRILLTLHHSLLRVRLHWLLRHLHLLHSLSLKLLSSELLSLDLLCLLLCISRIDRRVKSQCSCNLRRIGNDNRNVLLLLIIRLFRLLSGEKYTIHSRHIICMLWNVAYLRLTVVIIIVIVDNRYLYLVHCRISVKVYLLFFLGSFSCLCFCSAYRAELCARSKRISADRTGYLLLRYLDLVSAD